MLIGDALMARDPRIEISTWGDKSSASRNVRDLERPLECKVSTRIGDMGVLFLAIEDAPGPSSVRGFVERNSIALLSGYAEDPIDAPSADWLGRKSNRDRVKRSGLWNNNHVDENVHPQFLDVMGGLVRGVTTSPESVAT